MTGNASAQFITNTGIDIVNTGVVYTNGDWANQGNLRNDGTIITTDSWINTGTLDAASTGGFVLNYASNKTFTPGGASFGFIVKEGAGNADITGVFELRDSLSLKGGLLTPLTGADVVTINDLAKVESTPGSFLQGGNLVRKGTGNLFFPVGRGGNYLPITIYSVAGANPSVTVALEDAPTGFVAGTGVEALLDFPYVWRVTKDVDTETGGYVEVEYPEALTTGVPNPIVVRQIGADTYQGMGARFINTADGKTLVRSYSRGLEGTYSVARGFPGNLETDRLALEALYNATQPSTGTWTGKPTWLTNTDVTTWEGVTETGGYVTSLLLPNTGITGRLPETLADLGGLETIDLSGNNITYLPDLSGLSGIASLNVSNNRLGFGSIIPNLGVPSFDYSNQQPLTLDEEVLVDVGTDTSVEIEADHEGNAYQWTLNGTNVDGATAPAYGITAINRTNMGNYRVAITNPAVPGLTLQSGNKRVLATATISGTVYENTDVPLANGVVTLYRITDVGAYEIPEGLGNVALNADGTYTLQKVVLDDYVLLAQGNPDQFPNEIPTYYTDKIFWEEADPILLNDNVSDLNITLVNKPVEEPKGQGTISGTLEDTNIQEDGRTLRNKRIANAGASVRRRVNVGKPEDEELILIAYILTNEEGEFNFENLETGEYLLNLQYPGYPMDPTSFINISIGTGLARRAEVQALVEETNIVVKKLVITGWDEEEQRLAVFPNPANAHLHIKVLQGMNNLTYSIANAVGAEVMHGNLPFTGVATIETGNLPTGIYMVTVAEGGTPLQTFRIVITH